MRKGLEKINDQLFAKIDPNQAGCMVGGAFTIVPTVHITHMNGKVDASTDQTFDA